MHEMPIGKCNFSLKMTNNTGRNLIGSISISYLCLLKTFDWYLFFFHPFSQEAHSVHNTVFKKYIYFLHFCTLFQGQNPTQRPFSCACGDKHICRADSGLTKQKMFLFQHVEVYEYLLFLAVSCSILLPHPIFDSNTVVNVPCGILPRFHI